MLFLSTTYQYLQDALKSYTTRKERIEQSTLPSPTPRLY